jgi:uncharacterized membrane protein YeaQ/YmgE (transglycosylase-associated protein family)
MKKSKSNLILGMLITGIVGTAVVKTAEYMFGLANVFMFSVAVTAIVGVVVVPIAQMRKR